MGIVEHVADQGQRGRRQRRTRDPEQRAARDQHLGRPRKRGDHRGEPERCGADEEQPAAADPIAEGSHRNQRSRDEESVDVDDPQQLRAAGVEIGAQPGHGKIEHGEIHGVEQAWQSDDG